MRKTSEINEAQARDPSASALTGRDAPVIPVSPPYSSSSSSWRPLTALTFSQLVMFSTAKQKNSPLPAQKASNLDSSECFLTFGDEAENKGQIEIKVTCFFSSSVFGNGPLFQCFDFI